LIYLLTRRFIAPGLVNIVHSQCLADCGRLQHRLRSGHLEDIFDARRLVADDTTRYCADLASQGIFVKQTQSSSRASSMRSDQRKYDSDDLLTGEMGLASPGGNQDAIQGHFRTPSVRFQGGTPSEQCISSLKLYPGGFWHEADPRLICSWTYRSL